MTVVLLFMATGLGGMLWMYYQKAQEADGRNQQLQQRLDEEQQRTAEALAKFHEAEHAIKTAHEANSDFLANMSHELRTYLHVILGYTQVVHQHRLSKKQQKALNIIHRNSEQLLMIISDILDFSRIEAHAMQLEQTDFQLRKFLWNLIEIIRMQAEQTGVAIQTDFSSELPAQVRGDEKRLRQILLNLLDNAVKYTGKGTITFRALPIASSDQTASLIRLEIEDTGPGIPAGHKKNLFLPFYGGKNSTSRHDGTRLGLAISQKLAFMMDSQIKVVSTVGQGSTFWLDVNLPETAVGDEVSDIDLSAQIVGFKGTLRKVLIADDRYENRVLLKEMLLPLGFGILEAMDGFDVLTKAAKNRPDAILMDLSMPVLNGFEAIRHVRQMPGLNDVVVIGMSASVLLQIREESLKAGSNDFLTKPLHYDDVLACLHTHLHLEWTYGDAPNEE